MRFSYTFILFGLWLALFLYPTISQATHVRAGEITTRRISATSLTYEVTLTTYYDYTPAGRDAANAASAVVICFGDGMSSTVNRQPVRFLNGRTSTINVYRTTHTFPAGASYIISATIVNRNKDTKNLPPAASSDQIPFFVSTTIFINAQLGLNSTPVMLNPPLDSARVGQRFVHNPAAFDADGDSLAFRLSIPKEGLAQDCPRNRPISVYQDPTRFSRTSEAGGAPTFSINPRTGELSWDAPGEEGQFNVAFVVEEWRNGVLIGEVTRDMQIIVVDQPNKQPVLAPIPPICVEAGTLIRQAVTATDPDGNRVIINGFGGIFNVSQDGLPLTGGDVLIQPEYARLANGGVALAQPATATFTWQTNCNHIRQQPYDVIFKANDVPARPLTSLVAFQTFSIRIVGPSVKGLQARATASAGSRAVQLTWNPYTCAPRYGSDTTRLVVYRKEGCESGVVPPCQTGPPAGYQRVGTTAASATTYTDTTALRRGGSYSYILVAEYPDPSGGNNGGVSIPSSNACIELLLLAPVLTQVTVDSTGPDGTRQGQITVRWTRPLGLNPTDLGGPYQYRLQRATGLAGDNWTTVTTINTTLQAGAPDTVYVDRGASTTALNTVADAYRYRIQFFYTAANGQLTQLADVADPASSVRLSATPVQRRITLNWQANTPWSNENKTHDIYRSRTGSNGPFNLIASVSVQGPQSFTYVDAGNDLVVRDGNTSGVLSADSSYCYRVMTRGQYTDTQLARLNELINYSQITCAMPTDTTRPCPPRLGLDSLNCANLTNESFCDQTTFTNRLRWQVTSGPTCDPSIASYRIYYARYEQVSLRAISSVPAPTLTFDHGGLTTVAGCYYVTAVSQRGLESLPSNKVCNEACPALVLPNVFTPNGDGKNDVFTPMRCPRFVEQINFIVYNRWGTKVYESTGPALTWNGKTLEGADLPSGQYYYQATVRYAVLNRNAPAQTIKGWVQLIRDAMSMR